MKKNEQKTTKKKFLKKLYSDFKNLIFSFCEFFSELV